MLTWMVRGGLAMAAVGLAWTAWPTRPTDRWYYPRVEHSSFTRPWPRVLFDDGHLNGETSGEYRPFARLLVRDGFVVWPIESRITKDVLRSGDLFVTVNPLGYAGLAQHLATRAGVARAIPFGPDAFADGEIGALADWVTSGGRMLIIADYGPASRAARRLALAFGVEMIGERTGERGRAVVDFTRANGGLGNHPIMRGRSPAEQIEIVTTVAGQRLRFPETAAALLGQSEATQAVALRHGQGRVVVLGDAAAFSAQRIDQPGKPAMLIGMNRTGSDNQQFALNVIHWLMGLLD